MGDKFEIRKSQIDGKGVFGVKLIKKGELICCMNGEEISIPELKIKYEKGNERLSDLLRVGNKKYLDLYEPYIYVNHSCDPNATIVRFNELTAIKDIDAGQEITYDYSLTEWSDDESWRDYDEWFIECKCKSSSCRKQIREFRFLPKYIQEKCTKQRYVQDHIVRKYKRCHGA